MKIAGRLVVGLLAFLFLTLGSGVAQASAGTTLKDCLAAGGSASGKYCSNPGGALDGYRIFG